MRYVSGGGVGTSRFHPPALRRAIREPEVGEWILHHEQTRAEELMANKDKGGRSSKKVASKSLKEKRAAKKAKKAGN